MGNADNVLILKSEGTPPERLRRKWKCNTKVILEKQEVIWVDSCVSGKGYCVGAK
jgi:hypothetical protein